jgi:hypothetical protein
MRRILIVLSLASSLAAAPSAFLDVLSFLWSETGCMIDPSGRCIAPQTDEGCRIDPNGGCITERSDSGCRLDPNGGCLTPQRDEGCHIDPNGRCSS